MALAIITVLSHSEHCLRLSNKLCTLTDELCSYFKQSVSDRCLETLFCKWFIDIYLFIAVSLPLTAQNRHRERRHCAGKVRPRARGAALVTSSNWTIAKVFSKKLLGLSVCTCYGGKSRQKCLKVAKYCAKVALVCVWETRELMAAGGGYCCGPPQINQRMGNTGDCLWECQQFLSTQNE